MPRNPGRRIWGALSAPTIRRIVPEQLGLVPAFHDHIHSRELEAISKILDEHPEAAKWVHQDLDGTMVARSVLSVVDKG